MVQGQNLPNEINEFIRSQVTNKGLDERTLKAYKNDMELFYSWKKSESSVLSLKSRLEEQMEEYLVYLSKERGLKTSTINRKKRVFNYYLSYLAAHGKIKEYHSLRPDNLNAMNNKTDLMMGNPINSTDVKGIGTFSSNLLTKKEVDAFFKAINQEYIGLDSDFRKRVCLRDQVMMGMLFYHKIEISELLRMQISDYDQKTSVLIIPKKREKDREIYLFSKALQRQIVQWINEHEYFEHDSIYSNWMFLSKLGKPLSMKMVINIFDKYRTMAGIEKIYTPKDLKNSLRRYAEEMVMEIG